MKTIKGLDDQLTHFDPDASEKDRAQVPTMRKMFVSALGASTPDGGEQAIVMFRLGGKILDTKGPEVALEDAEFNLLKEKCGKNSVRWMAHYLAQVMIRLQEAEKAETK